VAQEIDAANLDISPIPGFSIGNKKQGVFQTIAIDASLKLAWG